MRTQLQIPFVGSNIPSPAYVLPLFRFPFGIDSGKGGAGARCIGVLTSSVEGSRSGEKHNVACKAFRGSGTLSSRGVAAGRWGSWAQLAGKRGTGPRLTYHGTGPGLWEEDARRKV
jgi:hypothetical protein